MCVSKLFELAKDKTLKVAERVKFLCKLFNAAEYVFTQHIVTLFSSYLFIEILFCSFCPSCLRASVCSFVVNATKVRRIIDLTKYYIKRSYYPLIGVSPYGEGNNQGSNNTKKSKECFCKSLSAAARIKVTAF